MAPGQCLAKLNLNKPPQLKSPHKPSPIDGFPGVSNCVQSPLFYQYGSANKFWGSVTALLVWWIIRSTCSGCSMSQKSIQQTFPSSVFNTEPPPVTSHISHRKRVMFLLWSQLSLMLDISIKGCRAERSPSTAGMHDDAQPVCEASPRSHPSTSQQLWPIISLVIMLKLDGAFRPRWFIVPRSRKKKRTYVKWEINNRRLMSLPASNFILHDCFVPVQDFAWTLITER